MEKSTYNETGKKSTGKLLELCVRVKQKLASSPALAVEVTMTDSPPYHPANEARSRHAALTLSVDLLENICNNIKQRVRIYTTNIKKVWKQ